MWVLPDHSVLMYPLHVIATTRMDTAMSYQSIFTMFKTRNALKFAFGGLVPYLGAWST